MQKIKKYKIAVLVLGAVVALEAMYIGFLLSRPMKKIIKIQARPSLVTKAKGRICIVLDDWGYTLSNMHFLDEIKRPLTLSVLPNLAYSKTVARDASLKGYEVILHLPMQPHEKYNLEKNTILISMGEHTIKRILDQDLENLGFAKGVSNHMGSLATENSRVMSVILAHLRKRKLYYLDSFVSQKSVCHDLAAKISEPCLKRDVFLDNKADPLYIRGQLEELKNKAGAHGQAIGIGHDRKLTLEVLKQMIPEIEKEGYRFVFASELIE